MVVKNVQNGPKKWSIGPVLDQLEIAKNASTTRVLGLFGPVTHFFCLFSVRKNFLYNNIEKKVVFWSIAKNEVFLQMKIERLGSMIPGTRCPVYVDGNLKYYTVQHDKEKGIDFIKIDGKKLTNDSFPFGEEIII